MIAVRTIFTPKQGKRSDAVALIIEPGAGFPFPSVFRVYTCWIGANDGKIALETEHESLADFEEWQAKIRTWASKAFWEKWGEVIKPTPRSSEMWMLET